MSEYVFKKKDQAKLEELRKSNENVESGELINRRVESEGSIINDGDVASSEKLNMDPVMEINQLKAEFQEFKGLWKVTMSIWGFLKK